MRHMSIGFVIALALLIITSFGEVVPRLRMPVSGSFRPIDSSLLVGVLSAGWRVTTYYTPVERYHRAPLETVRGCLQRTCTYGDDLIGNFPSDFVSKVKIEGSGLISAGPQEGRFLNWSPDTGFWVDTTGVDAAGNRLRPFVSAAADSTVLPRNITFQLVNCGSMSELMNQAACRMLRGSLWRVTDQFAPGYGGVKHVDLYIGQEARSDFENTSDLYVDLHNVEMKIEYHY